MKNYQKVLSNAFVNKYAIPHFNINNLEWAKYILEVCEEEKSPVFLGVSLGAAKYMGGFHVIRKMVDGLIMDLNIKVPVILHLDHANSVEACKEAYDAGFDSIMIDASRYSIEDNIKMTNEVINYCKNALIEAETGKIGGSEDNFTNEIYYTTFEEATNFLNHCAIDMYAPALGSVHGIYKSKPNINIDLMNKISSSNHIPLVLHGGSGLDDNILKESIKNGICKINFNTELQISWNKGVRSFINNNKDIYDPRKIISSGELNMKNTIRKYIEVLGSKNKGE